MINARFGRLAVALAFIASLVIPAVAAKKSPAEIEADIGREASKEIEKQFKVVDRPADLARINRVIGVLAPIVETITPAAKSPTAPAERGAALTPLPTGANPAPAPPAPTPPAVYTAKVLEVADPNALSLPGGYIYVTTGLLEAVESDDELAAVLAHEMAHNAEHHSLELARRDKRLNKQMVLAVLAAVFAASRANRSTTGYGEQPASVGMLEVVAMGQAVKTAIINGYSIEAEQQADDDALLYMLKSPYQPVALLTVLEGLTRMEESRPPVEFGYLQTHPASRQRMARIEQALIARNISINRRLVTRAIEAKADAVKVGNREVAQVTIGDKPVFQPAAALEGKTPLQRAEQMAAQINQALTQNLQVYELRMQSKGGTAQVLGRDQVLITVTGEDAAFHGATSEKLAQQAMAVLRLAFWKETVDRGV